MKCSDCDKEAIFVRCTQFAGEHPFCNEHAKKQKDWGVYDSSYFYWKSLEENERWWKQ